MNSILLTGYKIIKHRYCNDVKTYIYNCFAGQPQIGFAPPAQQGYGPRPPQQQGYGPPPHQQQGYGPPPHQQQGYGPPPPQQQGYGSLAISGKQFIKY